MFTIQADFDFSRIRHYHPEIDFIAKSKEKNNESITSVPQTAYLDLKSEADYHQFLIDYEYLLSLYKLQEQNISDILYLTQKTHSDIEKNKEIDLDLWDVKHKLIFLKDILKMQEQTKSQLPELSLSIQSIKQSSSASLKDPLFTKYIIDLIIKGFKDKSFNYQLSSILEDVTLTSSNITLLIQQLDYRINDIERYSTSETASRIHLYLNDHTNLKSNTGGLTNQQARFICELLALFNLLDNIIKPTTKIPRDKHKLSAFKTDLIRTLLKNHKRLQAN